jgi:beta-exotoxin I transport system permease protein
MTAPEALRRELLDHRRALVAWCVGIAAYVGLIAAIFPSIHGSAQFDRLIESYPDALKALFGLQGGSITTGAGYLDVELFSLMLPLLVLVLAIGAGARTFAGEEEAGRLELPLSYPVRRSTVVAWKGMAVSVEIAAAALAAGVAILVVDPVVGLELSMINLIEAVVALAILGILFGWTALAVGAAFPSRALAIGVPAGIAAAGYLVGGLHSLAPWLDPFRFVSPFWLVGTGPLRNGADLAGVIVVAAVAICVLLVGAWRAERRDLQTP